MFTSLLAVWRRQQAFFHVTAFAAAALSVADVLAAPVAAPRDMGSWGCFSSASELQQSPWGSYLSALYMSDQAYAGIPCRPSICQFPKEPETPYFCDEACGMGIKGCNADGVHVQCRWCGTGVYQDIPCLASVKVANATQQLAIGIAVGLELVAAMPTFVPGNGDVEASAVFREGERRSRCAFANPPTTPFYWEPACKMGMIGCNADDLHLQCRFCGEGVLSFLSYPFCASDIWMFYDSLVAKAGVDLPLAVGTCPSFHAPVGQRYDLNNMYQPSGVSWTWHAPPYNAFPSSTWVEVIHEADPFGDEHSGAWFMYAPGSGMWFDLGQTISFPEHDDAYRHFGASGNEDLARKAASAGYDSIQFLAHSDHVDYPCDQNVGVPYMNVEILGTKLVGTHPCALRAADNYNVIWVGRPSQGFGQPCRCDDTKRGLNCGVLGDREPKTLAAFWAFV